MSFRSYLQSLEAEQRLLRVRKPASKRYEVAGILKQLEPRPVLFDLLHKSIFRAAGNLFCTKSDFAAYFGVPVSDLIPLLTQAIERRTACPRVDAAACQEMVNLDPDLDDLPILRHCALDGGNYISSGRCDRQAPDPRAKRRFSSLYAVFQDRNGCAGGAFAPF